MKIIKTGLFLLLKLLAARAASPGDCIANEVINAEFANIISGGASDTYEVPDDSCCQETICLLPCPEEVSDPSVGK